MFRIYEFWLMMVCVVGLYFTSDSSVGMGLAAVGSVASFKLLDKVLKN